MNQILDKIREIGIVPVVVIEDKEEAVPLAAALCRGGLPCAEVTFRTDAAEEAIRIMKKNYPGMLIGAGTILSVEQIDKALAAGAEFIVSPGFDPEIVSYCMKKNITILPGCVSPSEMALAVKMGLPVIKFFPAEQAGGLDFIKAIAAPYNKLYFMPTGGINSKNVKEYLQYDHILACGGSWMVKTNLISQGKFDEIEKLTKEAAAIVKEIRGKKHE